MCLAASPACKGGPAPLCQLAQPARFLVLAASYCASSKACLTCSRHLQGAGIANTERLTPNERAGVPVQSVPLYLSEIAPPKLRGGLNFMFQLATTMGILIAQLVNLGALLAPLSIAAADIRTHVHGVVCT